jgi:hypothetical protein
MRKRKASRFKKLKRKNSSVRSALKKNEPVNQKDLSTYLQFNPPASDRWFQRRWKESGMLHWLDRFNSCEGPYIPDCINRNKKYVIEVNGSIHETPEMIKKDLEKKRYFESLKFKFFVVKPYDNKSFNELVIAVRELRISKKNKWDKEIPQCNSHLTLSPKCLKRKPISCQNPDPTGSRIFMFL